MAQTEARHARAVLVLLLDTVDTVDALVDPFQLTDSFHGQTERAGARKDDAALHHMVADPDLLDAYRLVLVLGGNLARGVARDGRGRDAPGCEQTDEGNLHGHADGDRAADGTADRPPAPSRPSS